MRSRGFTLFTALVSFILIALSVLVIQSMVRGERDKVELIAGIEEQSEMQAIADLTRADAIQYFNYSVRFQIENYLSDQGTGEIPLSGGTSWEDLKTDFIETFFAKCDAEGEVNVKSFASDLAIKLTTLTGKSRDIGFFHVSLEEGIGGTGGYQTTLTNTLAEAFCKSSSDNQFIEVVQCEDGNPEDCLGTFYITLDLTKLSETEYDSLPRIKVSNETSKRTITESILPRGRFRIYVPIRVFKAFAETRALAYEFEKESEGNNGWKANYGLFSPRIHNELEEMALGMCDAGYCAPRDNFFVPPAKKGISDGHGICPGGFGWDLPGFHFGKTVNLNCPGFWGDTIGGAICGGSTKYNPNDIDSMSKKIQHYAEQRLCFLAKKNYKEGSYLNADSGDGFNVMGRNLGQNGHPLIELIGNIPDNPTYKYVCPIFEAVVTTSSVESKKIISRKGAASNHSSSTVVYNGNRSYGDSGSDCPMKLKDSGIGFWFDGVETGVEQIGIGSSLLECDGLDFTSNLNPGTGLLESKALCTEISEVSLTLRFHETDDKYIVNKMKAEAIDEGIYYEVSITDVFTPFTARFEEELDTGTCALDGDASLNEVGCNVDDTGSGWVCESYYEPPSVGSDDYEDKGCQAP